jgi:hypothetical protein
VSDGPLQKSGRALHASDGLAGWGFHVVDLRVAAGRFTAKGQEGLVGAAIWWPAIPFLRLIARRFALSKSVGKRPNDFCSAAKIAFLTEAFGIEAEQPIQQYGSPSARMHVRLCACGV